MEAKRVKMFTVSKPNDLPQSTWRCGLCDTVQETWMLRVNTTNICRPCIYRMEEAISD